MTQAAQMIDRNVDPKSPRHSGSPERKTESTGTKVVSGGLSLVPDEGFTKAFFWSCGRVSPDIDLGVE